MNFIRVYNEFINESVYMGEHKSGLKVFVIPKEGFTKKYAIFGTKYGSIDRKFVPLGESDMITVPDGIAHFLEHKMFEQPDGTDAFMEFSKYGANANAYTSFTNTCYLFACTDNFYENFEHLLNFVQMPHFTDENVAKEQGIIGQEIRMYDDDPGWRVMFNLLGALYSDNPVKTDIAGTVESIAQIDKDVLYKCYNTFYNPSNMAVCIAGDVDIDKIGDMIEKLILDRPSGKVIREEIVEPTKVNQKLVEMNLDVSIPLFEIGFKDNEMLSGIDLYKKELAVSIILRVISGKSSKLFTDMYEEGLINEKFGSDFMMEEEFSCAMIEGESEEPIKVRERVEKYILEKLKTGITEEEFNRAKKAQYGDFLRQFNDVEVIAGSFIRNVLKGINTFDYMTVYNEMNLEYVNKVFKEVFSLDNMAMSIVWPLKNQE